MSREEIGFSDMGKYEFGGLEIGGKLENGYLLYIRMVFIKIFLMPLSKG